MPTEMLLVHFLRALKSLSNAEYDFQAGNSIIGGHPLIEVVLILLWLLVLPLFIPLIKGIFDYIANKIEKWGYTHFRTLKLYSLEMKVPNQVIDMILLTINFLNGTAVFIVISVSLLLIIGIFPGTREGVHALFSNVFSILEVLGQRLLSGLPNLVALTIIAVLTHYTLRIIRFLSNGFKNGAVKLSGLHPDLIEPTFQIIRFLVICLALVAAYPYIPGSDSSAFRYISIFLGFLLSLGSTSLVSNIVAGIVLTYMRGMKIGDRVQIADTIGDVVEWNLLVTRIRTIKNVVITIPNGLVLNSHIVNFSGSAKKRGLILHTSITIGYDVPWRQVHMLLSESARVTNFILEDPEPFVHQTSLNDYYITYELNAYTQKPEYMASIYSELHQNIQDHFNAAGVEILSPAYSAFRDGNLSTIPVGQHPTKNPSSTYRPGDILSTFMQGISVGTSKKP